MIQVKQNYDVYEIRFRYDPVFISLVKQIPGKQWNPDGKFWTIPKDKLGWLIKIVEDTPYKSQLQVFSEEQLNENASLDFKAKIPDIDVSKIPFYVADGLKPYEHQIDFMKYAIDRQQRGYRSGFLLADEQGLAKTIEIANLAIYNRKQYGVKHCLIICCVNSSKYSWQQDIQKHTNNKVHPYILGTRFKRDGSLRFNTGGKEKLEDLRTGHMYGDVDSPKLPYFLIVNIEALRTKEGKVFAFTKEIADLINKDQIGIVAIDEIHKNASPQSAQGKQLLALKKATQRKAQWFPMTGTPITSKPTDVFLPLKLVDAHTFTSYYTWCKEFCLYGGYGDHEIIGYKNIPRLKLMLQANMLRRKKADVLDLPPKIYISEYVENTKYQENLYEQVYSDIYKNRAIIKALPNPLSKFLRLRQVNGSPEIIDTELKVDENYIKCNAKLQKIMEYLEDIHERGEKVIIFSNWVEPLRTLYRFVSKKYKTCCFTGTMSEADREKHKQVFINNPNYTVLLGTVGAMGVNHTFTVANNVIFYDEPWNPSDKEQCADRCHRIGTTKSVNIITLLTKDTVDEKVHDILYTKEGISDHIVDNRLNLNAHPELLDILFSDTKSTRKGEITNEDNFF